jgi:hypothetical protein
MTTRFGATVEGVVRRIGRRAAAFTVICSFVLVSAVAVSHWHRATAASARITELEERLRENTLLARHLAHHVLSQSLDGPFLSGTDILTDTAVSIPLVQDGVYILTSAECRWTPLNYDAFRQLRAAGVRLVGIVIEDDVVVLRRHLESARLGFPVLTSPKGALVNAIPKYGTPFLVVVREGKITHLEAGVLDSNDVTDILQASGAA